MFDPIRRVTGNKTSASTAHAPGRDFYSFARTEIEKACANYDKLVRERPLTPPARKGWVKP